MDLKLDIATNDLMIESGDAQLINGADEVGQRIHDRLSTFLGEWFLNLLFGVDYRGKILIKNPRTSVISAHLRSEILKSTSGKITSFNSTIDNRVLSVKYSVLIDGEEITGEI